MMTPLGRRWFAYFLYGKCPRRSLEERRQMVVYDEPEVLAGIQRGLDEVKLGLGRPFEEFDAEFRAPHKIPRDA